MTRLPYEEAVKHRPPGACHCDLNDRECYAQRHWEARPIADCTHAQGCPFPDTCLMDNHCDCKHNGYR
jgi:hypothetical protein